MGVTYNDYKWRFIAGKINYIAMFDYQRVLPKVVYGMNEHLNTKNR